MNPNIAVRHSESGCWMVLRGTYIVDIYPSHMWVNAYKSACFEARYQNLSIVGMDIT